MKVLRIGHPTEHGCSGVFSQNCKLEDIYCYLSYLVLQTRMYHLTAEISVV